MTTLAFVAALASTVMDAVGVVLLKQSQTVKGVGLVAIHSIIDVLVIKYFPAHVFTALSGVGVIAAAIIANEDINGAVWTGIGILVASIVVVSVMVAELPQTDENDACCCSVPILFACVASACTAAGLAFCRFVYLKPDNRKMSEKLALIAAVGATSAINLQYVEIMTRCKVWNLAPAIVANGLAELAMVKCSLMMSPVTLHVPVSFFLWQTSGFLTDLRMVGKSDALLFSILPTVVSVLGVTMIVAGSNKIQKNYKIADVNAHKINLLDK